MVFIPKVSKIDHSTAKDYRSLSLKLWKGNWRGKFTETALYVAVSCIEESINMNLENKGVSIVGILAGQKTEARRKKT